MNNERLKIYFSILASVGIPALQAFLLGIPFGVICALLAYFGQENVWIAFLLGLSLMMFCYLLYKFGWMERIITVEMYSMPPAAFHAPQDLPPILPIPTVREFELTREQLRIIARRILDRNSVGYRDLLELFGGNATALADFRAELLQKGYCVRKSENNPQSGLLITDSGMQYFMSEVYTPTLPASDELENSM